MSEVKVWKCGTNWDDQSILDIIVDFRIAFFGTDTQRMGNYENVNIGDLICLAKGTNIVAIAKVLSKFGSLSSIGKNILPRAIIRYFEEESGSEPFACKISNVLWLKQPIKYECQYRFCELKSCNENYKLIVNAWNEYLNKGTEEEFNIDAKRKTLVSDNSDDSLFSGSNIRYSIPVYQRPYAWGELEVSRLLDDILEGFQVNEKKFIGSIQISASRSLGNGICSYELIDGQQRLTTLLILLKHLNTDYTECLRTTVNAGSAQRDWDDFCDSFGIDVECQNHPLNKYISASKIIKNWLNNISVDLNSLKNYIATNLIFVVIQTSAGISKTIQIFDVINTAGMDLNAADIFKIRFYEYLTLKEGRTEEIFNQISNCYQLIDDYNRGLGYVAISMSEVMSFYQKILISLFDLNSELFNMASTRFFERLFDVLINGKSWPGFSKEKEIKLTLEGFERSVTTLIEFNKIMRENTKLEIVHTLLWETRYGEVAYLYPPLVCYFTNSTLNATTLIEFTENLFKRLVSPSLMYSKVVNDVRSRQMLELLKAFAKPTPEEYQYIINTPWTINGYSEKEMLNHGLGQEIASISKWKNLVCKLIEYLLDEGNDDSSLKERLFERSFDIEHIQPYTDENDREGIWKSWEGELNSLGNLMMLEFSLNRSIQNDVSQKITAYSQSKFMSVKKVKEAIEKQPWTLEQAKARRKILTEKICSYILSSSPNSSSSES